MGQDLGLCQDDWETLVSRIRAGKCTPFIGAGACAPFLPLAKRLARDLARQERYPFPDKTDLARVTQYIAVTRRDGVRPKEKIAAHFKRARSPDFNERDEPHGLLADLRLPIYLTTNYDDFMIRALRSRVTENAEREICRWNQQLLELPSKFDSGFDPTAKNPVVFHLHGHADQEDSIVVTEDDYLDFLVNISRDLAASPTGPNQKAVLPLRIRNAIKNTTLLFIGYGLSDINFRVILRGLLGPLERSSRHLSITVQLKSGSNDGRGTVVRGLQTYMEQYFDWTLGLRVFWGSAREFAQELRHRLGRRHDFADRDE